MMFVITISKNGATSAKVMPLPKGENDKNAERLPPLIMTELEVNMAKDVWINTSSDKDCIQSIGKATSDDCLNCNVLTGVEDFDADNLETLKNLK